MNQVFVLRRSNVLSGIVNQRCMYTRGLGLEGAPAPLGNAALDFHLATWE